MTLSAETSFDEEESRDHLGCGLIEKPETETYMHGTHAITDEASDTLYALFENGAVEGGPHLLTSPE